MAPFTEIRPQLKGDLVLLFNWGIDDELAEEIGPALRENRGLTALNLGGNQIGDRGAMSLFPALLDADRLAVLHLHKNRLGDGGMAILAEAAKAQSSLRELYLGDNQIGDIGAEALAGALRGSCGLVKLQLADNCIGDSGADALAEALVKNQTLGDLDVSRNKFTNTGVSRLQTAEMGHPSLRRLALKGNGTPEKVPQEPPAEVKLGMGEYLVEVDTSQEKFGINLQIDKLNRTLKISSMDSGGLIARWCEDHTDEAISIGDLIVQVNGCSIIDEILAECRKSQVQRVVFKRADSILKPNNRIQLLDHRDRPQEKGKLGRTVQWYGSMMRWKVRLDDGTVLMCRGEDLRRCSAQSPTEFVAGDVVYSTELKEQGIVCARSAAAQPGQVPVAFANLGCREVARESLQTIVKEEGVSDTEFFVFLEKGTGSKLGLDVKACLDGSLQVTSIGNGLVQEWNHLSTFASSIRVGDRIVQVNSTFGHADKLLEECRESTSLMIRLHREESTSAPCTVHQ